MEKLLSDGLAALGITLDAGQTRQLESYLRELLLWNEKYGLVNAAGDELIIKHFLDSFSSVPLLKKMSFDCACDVGSGGGFPGLILAIAFPDKKFSLIERSGRKADFLATTAVIMRASNVEVLNTDASLVEDRFQMVFFRALGKFNEYFPSLYRLAEKGGRLFAFKGKRLEVDRELAKLPPEVQNCVEIIKVQVPFLEDERNFVLVGKA